PGNGIPRRARAFEIAGTLWGVVSRDAMATRRTNRRIDSTNFKRSRDSRMASAALPRAGTPLARAQDLILPVALVASILVILVPLPAALLDLLLAANITVAVIVLLTS